MRYRRLGDTEQMVSEVGLDVRSALAGGDEAAEVMIRRAIDAGVTVFAWDVSDAAEDLEPLLVRAAGVDRGRLTLVATLDILPAPEAMGPQAEAIASRLAEPGAEGYLDVLVLPGLPDAAQQTALDEVRARGVIRFVGHAAEGDAEVATPTPDGLDVLVLSGAPRSDRPGVGVLARADGAGAAALIEGGRVASVITSAVDATTLARLLAPLS